MGNNFPVFFVRDGIKFPDMVHALKPNPKNHIQEGWRIADFFSHIPESMHMVRCRLSITCPHGRCKAFRGEVDSSSKLQSILYDERREPCLQDTLCLCSSWTPQTVRLGWPCLAVNVQGSIQGDVRSSAGDSNGDI